MISEKTLQHPILTLMVFVLLGVVGFFTMGNTAISLWPDVDMPYLMVTGTYSNAGPESVEKSVTTVLEGALVSLSDLESITSTSSEGSATVSLEFQYGTNLDVATNDVRDKLDRVSKSLPDDVTVTILKMSSDSMPIMRIALRGNRSADDLKAIADNTVTDILEQADGVAEATTMGGRTQIVRVELEQNRLAAYGLTLSAVASALSTQNLELGGGTITEGVTDYSIRTTGEYSSIDEINNTVITTLNGYDLKLKDIGRAFMGYSDTSSQVFIDGQPGVYISITKQSGENSVTVANAVYEKIAQVQKMLPSDVTLQIISDSTETIRDTINTLVESAVQGLLLAVIVLYVFLCNFKSTIIIAISIPLSIIITLLCMNFVGITLNMMTLTGLILGVGMIVDASIVMIDNIYTYRSRGAKPKISAILGSSEMVMSVVSGNLTTICVFIPFLFFIKDLGFMGQMFKGIIFTVVIALVSSLFVAIFLVPVLAGHFFPLTNRNEKPVRSVFFRGLYGFFNRSQDAIQVVYSKVLMKALNNRAVAVVVCVSALVISLLFIPTMRVTMIAGGHDDSVTLNMTLPVGTTIGQTTSVVNRFQQIIEKEVKGYTTLITSIGGGRNGKSYSGSIQIQLPESSQQVDNDTVIQAKLRKHFDEFTDVTFSFGRGTRQQLAGDDLDVVLRGNDLDQILAVANQIVDVMNQIPDIGEPSVDTTEGLPQVEIEIDRQRAYNFGVSVQTVANEIYASIEGTSVTTYRENGEDYSVYVMLRPEDRAQVIDLEQIYVKGTNGLVSVANFASVVKGLGPVSIAHENRSRIVHITAGILSDTNANVVEDMIKEGISNTFIIPDGVHVSYEGSWQDTQKQGKTYLLIIAMAIILVFGVMAATYESFKAPIINLTTIPFLAIGVIVIYKIANQPISMMSAIGLIMLVGIVVNNGIILVDYTNLLLERGMKMQEACYEAGCSRLRPVLMTTLTTILGMIPMCFASTGSAGMVQPIGVAVVGGLTSSTFITLFFIPVLYSLIMREKKHEGSRIEVELPGLPADTVVPPVGGNAAVPEEGSKAPVDGDALVAEEGADAAPAAAGGADEQAEEPPVAGVPGEDAAPSANEVAELPVQAAQPGGDEPVPDGAPERMPEEAAGGDEPVPDGAPGRMPEEADAEDGLQDAVAEVAGAMAALSAGSALSALAAAPVAADAVGDPLPADEPPAVADGAAGEDAVAGVAADAAPSDDESAGGSLPAAVEAVLGSSSGEPDAGAEPPAPVETGLTVGAPRGVAMQDAAAPRAAEPPLTRMDPQALSEKAALEIRAAVTALTAIAVRLGMMDQLSAVSAAQPVVAPVVPAAAIQPDPGMEREESAPAENLDGGKPHFVVHPLSADMPQAAQPEESGSPDDGAAAGASGEARAAVDSVASAFQLLAQGGPQSFGSGAAALMDNSLSAIAQQLDVLTRGAAGGQDSDGGVPQPDLVPQEDAVALGAEEER